ncbi:MAG: GDP-mannose 4,6-dehydratase [Verrucomicrobia bacterium]|nr:MAG: GDP-mannose 4,6-dehydratase [Verrucomicrobiota bacterium]
MSVVRSALIIGASGQDGRLLARLLQDRNYAVRGWIRRETEMPAPCECALVDLLDSAVVETALRRSPPDEIYYLAAFHHATEDAIELSAPELLRCSFDVHVLGLLNVFQAMEECSPRTRLFYAASSHVFGVPTSKWQNEQTPLKPNSAYGISKAAGLQCCQLYRQQSGMFAATGILFNHESALRKPSFLSQKIVRGALRSRRDPTYKLVLGDLEARVDWGYAPDYVEAMFRILQLAEASDFVVASGELHTVREFAQIAFGAVGLDWRQHVETDVRLLNKTSHPLRGDSGKLRAATGWTPGVTFREMVVRLVEEAGTVCEIS